jgi:hypothetical protein
MKAFCVPGKFLAKLNNEACRSGDDFRFTFLPFMSSDKFQIQKILGELNCADGGTKFKR